MSGIYVLLLIAIWLGLSYAGYRLWRRSGAQAMKTPLSTAVALLVAALWVMWPFWEVAGRKMYYDAQVRELCANDGGVKVYETVTLSMDKFDKWNFINFYRPTQGENALGPEYVFKEQIQYYRRENPAMVRYQHQVLRRSDGKLLGETISYGRGGGDLPGPWELSNFHCPPTEQASEIALLTKVFLRLQ